MAFADFVFTQVKPMNGGGTYGQHKGQVEKTLAALGEPVVVEEKPKLPLSLKFLFTVFNELHSARSVGFNGPNPVSYSDIWAWCRLCGVKLSPYEIGVIRKLDDAYLKKMTEGKDAGGSNRVGTEAIDDAA